jgi:hypothetical protein
VGELIVDRRGRRGLWAAKGNGGHRQGMREMNKELSCWPRGRTSLLLCDMLMLVAATAPVTAGSETHASCCVAETQLNCQP